MNLRFLSRMAAALMALSPLLPRAADAIDDQEVEYLAEHAHGIATVKVVLSPAGSYGPNTHLVRSWIEPLPPGVELAKDWDRGCLPRRRQLETALKRFRKERLPGAERLQKALSSGEFQLVLFFKGLRGGRAHVWCEGQSIVSGLGWLSHPRHAAWMTRLYGALYARRRAARTAPVRPKKTTCQHCR